MISAMDSAIVTGLNPSSQHADGREARRLLERARRQVAAAAGTNPEQLVFTGSATEAANWVLGLGWDAIILSSIEHDCVRAAANRAERAGTAVRSVKVDASGRLDLEALENALADADGERTLVALMVANNETGALQPVEQAVEIARCAGASILLDAAQALGKTNFDFGALQPDYAFLSGHKIGGPTGIGALLIRPGLDPAPLIVGGGQETRRRAGTENLLGAIGFGAAAAAFDRETWRNAAPLRDRLEKRLDSGADGLVFFAQGINRLPTTSCVGARGWRAETQLMQLDLAGFAVSAGSACSSGKLAASHVLSAMGADEELAACSIRISFGPDTSEEELQRFADAYLRLWARAAGRQT